MSVDRNLNRLARMPGTSHTTMTTKEYRALLLKTDGWLMLAGRMYDIKGENLGAGVYRVTTKKRET